MISWNTCKKNPCCAKHIAKSLKKLGGPNTVVCLQEIPKWVAGSKLMGFTVLSSRTAADRAEGRDGFDCGFLVPDHLNPLIRDERHRRYWSGLLLASILILIVHVILSLSQKTVRVILIEFV